MTDNAIRQALLDASVEVLEKMFFIEAGGEATAGAPVEDSAVTVELTFDGAPPGVFRMSLAKAAAALIAADFLGEEPQSLTPRQTDDVVKELANMICGVVLSRIESSATFRLLTPRLVADDVAGWNAIQGTVCAVETGSGILKAGIHMDTKACTPTERSAS